MKWWISLLSILVLVGGVVRWLPDACAQPAPEHHHPAITSDTTPNSPSGHARDGWEGSEEGIAYSEFNHRFAGLFVLLFGLAELGHGLRYPLPFWTRLVLPCALAVIGVYLLVWSDHEAWPIGALTFVQTLTGHDPEILQHKFYGVFSATAAVSETFRRMGCLRHPAWAVPLVFLGLIGAPLLFVHSHGDHPANQTIELHHALLGSLGIGAAVSSAMVAWASGISPQTVKRWELAWAGLVILMGLQLLVYFE
jgi:hypothetical protein